MRKTVTRGAFCALAFFFALAAAASTSPQLQVVSTTLDTNSRRITYALKNTAKVPAVAWMLRLTQTDANNKVVSELNSGEEYVYAFAYPDDPEEEEALRSGFIQPGQTITRGANADPKAVHAQVTVLAVVYADRRAEGNEKEINMVFAGRAQDAKELADAAASPESNAKVIAEHSELKTPPSVRAQALEAQSRRAQ
jgi:hypothetical protein